MHQNRVTALLHPLRNQRNFLSPPALTAAFAAALLGPLTAAAQTAPAAPALTSPGLVAASTIQGADTAWLMISTALVLLMTLPGIALFYGGMVRRFNVINTMASVVGIAAVVSLLWFGVAYSLAFTPGGAFGGFIGGFERAGFSGMEFLGSTGQVAVSHIAKHVPESVFAMFQLTFAIITCALVVGALVERMHFGALLTFTGLWLGSRVAGWRSSARSTLPAARWCTSTPVLPRWSAPTHWARVRAMAASRSFRSTWV